MTRILYAGTDIILWSKNLKAITKDKRWDDLIGYQRYLPIFRDARGVCRAKNLKYGNRFTFFTSFIGKKWPGEM